MHWRRNIGWIVLLTVIGLAVGYGFLPQPILVEVSKARRGALQVTVEEEGKTRVIDRYVVSAPVAGFARRVLLDVGDPVKHQQSVAQLEPSRSTVLDPRTRAEAEARLAAAEAALRAAEETARRAQADSDYATSELERHRRLATDGIVSPDSLLRVESTARQAVAEHRSAEFRVEVARHEVNVARAALGHSAAEAPPPSSSVETVAIKTPVEGRVLKVFHESEGIVLQGEPLLEVGDPRALEVEVDVLSADAVRIEAGMRVLFDRWGGPQPLEGRVRVVEPVGFTKVSALGVEEQRVLIIVDLTSPTAQWLRLGDGYRVEASFILWEGDDVLQVPASALFRYRDGWAVFVVEDSRARRRVVELGHRSGLHAEVVAGLRDDELVVPHPSAALDDGVRVEIEEDA